MSRTVVHVALVELCLDGGLQLRVCHSGAVQAREQVSDEACSN